MIIEKEAQRSRTIGMKIYNEIIIKEVLRLRTIGAKLYSERSPRQYSIKNYNKKIVQKNKYCNLL